MTGLPTGENPPYNFQACLCIEKLLRKPGPIKYNNFVKSGHRMDHQDISQNNPAKCPPVERIGLPFKVPYYAQVASPEWAEAVFDRGVDPRGEPHWGEWAACDPEEYAYWCPRACGPVCVKMCIEAMGGVVKPVMGWVRQGLEQDGYEIRQGMDGQPVEVGWRHAALAGLIASSGFFAQFMRIANDKILEYISAGQMLIASVSFEIGTQRPVTRQGGHLVVVTGADTQAGETVNFLIHNPSGRTQDLRENALIPAERFSQAYSGRAIVVSDRPIDLIPQENANV
jgi:hypothetical protein